MFQPLLLMILAGAAVIWAAPAYFLKAPVSFPLYILEAMFLSCHIWKKKAPCSFPLYFSNINSFSLYTYTLIIEAHLHTHSSLWILSCVLPSYKRNSIGRIHIHRTQQLNYTWWYSHSINGRYFSSFAKKSSWSKNSPRRLNISCIVKRHRSPTLFMRSNSLKDRSFKGIGRPEQNKDDMSVCAKVFFIICTHAIHTMKGDNDTFFKHLHVQDLFCTSQWL